MTTLKDILIEITVNKYNIKPTIYRGTAVVNTLFFREDDYVNLIDLGQWYTFIPGAGQKIYLFPKNYFVDVKEDSVYKNNKDMVYHIVTDIKDLLKRKEYQVITVNTRDEDLL